MGSRNSVFDFFMSAANKILNGKEAKRNGA